MTRRRRGDPDQGDSEREAREERGHQHAGERLRVKAGELQERQGVWNGRPDGEPAKLAQRV